MAITLYPLLITCAICYGIFHYVMWHFRRRRLYVLASKFDGPPALPFIGNAHQMMGNGERILKSLIHLGTSYPAPIRMWLGPLLLICLGDPETMKAVCLSPKLLEKGEYFSHFLRPLGGDGLITGPTSIWKVHRKLIQPTFNVKILESFVKIFVSQTKILAEKMARNLDGEEFEIFSLISACTLDMVCETTMGVKVKTQTGTSNDYVEAVQTELAGVSRRLFHIWLYPDFIFNRTKLARIQEKCMQRVHGFVDNVIKLKKKEFENRESRLPTTDDKDNAYESKSGRTAFLDHLMALPEANNLSDTELRDEINTMVVSGYDTTALTSSYVLLMLASHPDIQEKAYQELYEIYGNDDIEDHPISPEDLPRMKYLDRVIKETMRLFPPAPFIIRHVPEDVTLGDVTYPKGASIVLGLITVQRNEKYWPDPLKFDPERWLPEEMAKRDPCTFMAFSTGPRNCIGMNYGSMSMKTLVATILRRYILKKDKIVPVKDIRLKIEMALKPVYPLKIRIEKRTRN